MDDMVSSADRMTMWVPAKHTGCLSPLFQALLEVVVAAWPKYRRDVLWSDMFMHVGLMVVDPDMFENAKQSSL